MRKKLLFGLALAIGSFAFGQDLPTNPEPGKCYVRCVTPDVYENQEVQIMISPAYKKLKVVPAKYTSVNETVLSKIAGEELAIVPASYGKESFEIVTKEASQRLVRVGSQTSRDTETVVVKEASFSLRMVPAVYENRTFDVVTQPAYQKVVIVPAVYETRDVVITVKDASQRLEVVPAVWGTETITYKKREYGSSIRVVPASFTSDFESVEVKPAAAEWQMSEIAPADCNSSNPDDCRYWCYKGIPAQNVTVPVTRLASDATSNITPDCDPNNNGGKPCGEATFTRTIMVTPASTRVVSIPAITKTVKKTVMVTPPTTRVVDVPEVRKTMKRSVMVTPPTTTRVEIPAVTETVKKTIITNETTRVEDIPSISKTYTKTVMTSAPSTRAIPVAQREATLKTTKLVSDASVVSTDIPAVFKTVTKEILTKKGGLTTWTEVECKFLTYNDLNINWNLGSATLTAAAKREIDAKLLPVLQTGVSVEIASHTDSRGTKESNVALSQRRAQAVTNYLISKNINASKIVSNGYGERKLTNRCADGVSCTEREHLANRRTQFRVLDQKN
ncbi:Outer membrane protein P6 [Kordia antarctica]|uniref:Outer membrane protein P6 n=1 Tax=Kordia antarctica TaxID=1218801 RepID=A0A7L4ZHG9_9FLAO|nr:OmpA family protein [Kordia antarctica]QHI35917.1 Outer membrane protein P6 [Kordia antarctica]